MGTQLCVQEMKGPVVWKEAFRSIPSVATKGATAENNRKPQQRETTGGRNCATYTIAYIRLYMLVPMSTSSTTISKPFVLHNMPWASRSMKTTMAWKAQSPAALVLQSTCRPWLSAAAWNCAQSLPQILWESMGGWNKGHENLQPRQVPSGCFRKGRRIILIPLSPIQ